MVKRAAVNKVVRMVQSKTVARIDGKRVFELVKPGKDPNAGCPCDSAVVDIATCAELYFA